MSTIIQGILCYGVKLPKEFTDKYDLDCENSELKPACLELVTFGHGEIDATILALASSYHCVESDNRDHPMEVDHREDIDESDVLLAFCHQFKVSYEPKWFMGVSVC